MTRELIRPLGTPYRLSEGVEENLSGFTRGDLVFLTEEQTATSLLVTTRNDWWNVSGEDWREGETAFVKWEHLIPLEDSDPYLSPHPSEDLPLAGWEKELLADGLPRVQLLADARKAVTQFRESDYGGPEQSFERIAVLWTEWLSMVHGVRILVRAEDVPVMMSLLKVARLAQDIGHRDSILDIAGYAACLAEVIEREV